MPPLINYSKCSQCKTCYENCPTDIFAVEEEKNLIFVKYPDECWICGACEFDCPKQAIKLEIPLACL